MNLRLEKDKQMEMQLFHRNFHFLRFNFSKVLWIAKVFYVSNFKVTIFVLWFVFILIQTYSELFLIFLNFMSSVLLTFIFIGK